MTGKSARAKFCKQCWLGSHPTLAWISIVTTVWWSISLTKTSPPMPWLAPSKKSSSTWSRWRMKMSKLCMNTHLRLQSDKERLAKLEHQGIASYPDSTMLDLGICFIGDNLKPKFSPFLTHSSHIFPIISTAKFSISD